MIATLLLGVVLLLCLVSGTWVVLQRATAKTPTPAAPAAVAQPSNAPPVLPAR